jgi:hypothetical protein
MPHLLVGFSLAAGFAVGEAAYLAHHALSIRGTRLDVDRAVRVGVWFFIVGYGGAGVAYYEKWYSTARKSELVPYEATAATLRTLVPPGPKYLYASPQFWTPFHADGGTIFYSYAAAQPVDSGSTIALAGVNDDRPIFLLVDEFQWLPELTRLDRLHRTSMRARGRRVGHGPRYDRPLSLRARRRAARQDAAYRRRND